MTKLGVAIIENDPDDIKEGVAAAAPEHSITAMAFILWTLNSKFSF